MVHHVPDQDAAIRLADKLQARSVQAGTGRCAGGAPVWVDLVPILPSAVDNQGVAGLHCDALLLGDVLQLPAMDGVVLGDKGLTPVLGDVQEHAARDDSILPMFDGPPLGAVESYHLQRVAAIPHTVGVPHMAQGVQVGGCGPMVGNAVVVSCAAAAILPDIALHVVDGR